MIGTILTYLKEYGEKPLSEMEFNDVDSLILCQFAYLKFDGLVPDVNQNLPPVALGDLARHPERDRLFGDERFGKVNRELFREMLESRRFGGMLIGAYVNLIEKDWETQFSAVTFTLENGVNYLAFRGTDESIVGWKEDCNMAFLDPIPAQHCAVKYCNLAAGRFSGPFFLGGHSKGGNLALFAAMNCADPVRERISKIYSMDGPGFRPEIRKKYAYERIEDKVVKLLPRSSFIGMLFEQEKQFRVVESKSFGLFQHNPFSWIVEEDHFKAAPDLHEGSRLIDETVNEWILSLREEQVRVFTDTLFTVLEASGAEDLLELTLEKKLRLQRMGEALKNVEPETGRMIREMLRNLFEIAGENAMEELDRKRKRAGIGDDLRKEGRESWKTKNEK